MVRRSYLTLYSRLDRGFPMNVFTPCHPPPRLAPLLLQFCFVRACRCGFPSHSFAMVNSVMM